MQVRRRKHKPLCFDYVLDGAGWATATVGVGGREVTMTISYRHDSLGQLAGAISQLEAG